VTLRLPTRDSRFIQICLPLHNIYVDYRNHPTFFRKMGRFIKALEGYRVQFEQPRLLDTAQWRTQS
jgi:hypothetical protein